MASRTAVAVKIMEGNERYMEQAARIAEQLGIEPLSLPMTNVKEIPPFVMGYLDNLTSFTLSALEALAAKEKKNGKRPHRARPA